MGRYRLFWGLCFALLAGVAAPFFILLGLGHAALGCVVVSAVAAHLVVVSEELRKGIRAAGLALVLGLPCVALLRDVSLVTVLSILVLGLCRSAVLYPRPFARALFAELVFLGAGTWVGFALLANSLVGVAFAVWAFWLVQAGFALTVTSSKPSAPAGDAFERAQAVAEAVLAGRPR